MNIKLANREYNLTRRDLVYAVTKSAGPALRGVLRQLIWLKRPSLVLIGTRVRVLEPRMLHLEAGASIGMSSYLDCSSEHGVRIGKGSTIREFGWVQSRSGLNDRGHSLVVGPSVYIGPHAVIGVGGPVVIEGGTQIGARLAISAESHAPGEDGSYVGGDVARRGVTIGENVWIGNGVCVLDGVNIGRGAVIGAGAVVTKDIPANAVAYGNPARVVRRTGPSETSICLIANEHRSITGV